MMIPFQILFVYYLLVFHVVWTRKGTRSYVFEDEDTGSSVHEEVSKRIVRQWQISSIVKSDTLFYETCETRNIMLSVFLL